MTYKVFLILSAIATAVVGISPAGAATPREHLHAAAARGLSPAVRPAELSRAFNSSALPHSTFSHGGVIVKVPTSVVTYNKARYRLVPKVSLARGTQKVLGAAIVTAYSGKRQVAKGRTVSLPIGRYTTKVTVPFRAYYFVTKYRTVTKYKWVTKYKDVTTTVDTLHPGGYPDGTDCSITAVSSSANDGVNDTIDTATCINSGYPDQSVPEVGSDLYDLTQGDDSTVYTVGQHVVTNGTVYFDDFHTTAQVTKRVAYQVKVAYKVRESYRVKMWRAASRFVTPRRTLVVEDGGFQRIFEGVGDSDIGSDFTTSYFTVPKSWKLAYSYDCSDTYIDSGNWILDVHRRGDPSFYDTNLNNDISSGDTALWNLTGAGTYRLHVFTECIWAIVVRWR